MKTKPKTELWEAVALSIALNRVFIKEMEKIGAVPNPDLVAVMKEVENILLK